MAPRPPGLLSAGTGTNHRGGARSLTKHQLGVYEHEHPFLEVFFLPLAVADPAGVRKQAAAAGLRIQPGVLTRRIPDFLHTLLNRGYPGPTGLLNVQASAENGPVTWAELREVPSAEEAFAMIPDEAESRAVVTGNVGVGDGALELTVQVHRAEDLDAQFGTTIQSAVRWDDPVPDLVRVARKLARLLELPEPQEDRQAHTHTGAAFFKLLEGIDNAALVTSSDGDWTPRDQERLLAPFHQALDLDPGFGLALRALSDYVSLGVDSSRLSEAACTRLLDRCFSTGPADGEGCVSVAEHFTRTGDRERAQAWLEHATHLDPPPPRGLENLGIMFANKGQLVHARELWLKGFDVDGHPDFCAHLARLAFTEGREVEAWNQVHRGLRRIQERCMRAAEWDDDGRGTGVLLRYLVEHLEERRAPDDVVEALIDLVDLLEDSADRLDLGLCLLAVDQPMDARDELQAGLLGDVDAALRDLAVRGLLRIAIQDFEKRFARAVDDAVTAKGAHRAVRELTVFFHVESRFWPALFFMGLAKKQLGQPDDAIDDLAHALRLSPRQPDVLREIAVLYDERGNPKRALECVELALQERPDEPELMIAKVRYLWRLARGRDARQALRMAEGIAGRHKGLARLRQEIVAGGLD